MGSPLAGAWLPLHLAGCTILLYNGKYDTNSGNTWYACLIWLIAIGVSTFFLAPIQGAGATMWVLVAMPSLALCLRKEHLKDYLICFGGAAALYAFGVVGQWLLDVQYTMGNPDHLYSWPMLDANNGAVIINMVFLPVIYMTFFDDLRWGCLWPLLVAGLVATGSKAGAAEAALGLMAFTSVRYGAETLLLWVISIATGLGLSIYYCPDKVVHVFDSLATRFPIWDASVTLLELRPIRGLGLGSFGLYYPQVRTEFYTQGGFAHNDVLQFAVEMGVPAAMAFVALIITIGLTTWRGNLMSGVTLMAIFVGSLVEFQYYVPAISLGAGLLLGYHIINRQRCAFSQLSGHGSR